MTTLTLSPSGAVFIARFEGFRREQYICLGGHATIGYGHRLLPTEDIHRVTEGEALDLLIQDAAREAAPVGRALQVPLEQHQMDAMMSLAFNCGGGAIARSTLVERLNAGDKAGAAEQFLRWSRAGGRVSKGLAKRRLAEQVLFLTGTY